MSELQSYTPMKTFTDTSYQGLHQTLYEEPNVNEDNDGYLVSVDKGLCH